MEQSAVNDFLKQLAVGFRSAKSYPPGHPVMDKVINKTMEELSRVYSETNEFSMFFLEQTVIFQDLKIDVSKNPAIRVLLEALRKIDVDSLTFKAQVMSDDIKNLYSVLTTPRLKMQQYGDAATMLEQKGTKSIEINAVKFGVQTDGTVEVSGASSKTSKTKEEILAALKNLKTFVEKEMSVGETKDKLSAVINDIDASPVESRKQYAKKVAEIINAMSVEHRTKILQGMDMKSFMVQLLAGAKSDFLVNLVTNWLNAGKQENVRRLFDEVGEDKFARMLPALREKMPNIYEHLAQTGVRLLLSDKLSTVVTDDDLRMSINPYFAMLDSQNAKVREQGLQALLALGKRFVSQDNIDVSARIISRVAIALDQEPVIEIIGKSIEEIEDLFIVSRKHHQKDFCTKLLEPFNSILSREGLPIALKREIITFFGDTGHPLALSILFSFIWESGIYPEVRSAIVKFGAAAVNEALVTLRDVEDYNIRMRLVDILKTIGEQSVNILLKNMNAPEWYLRRNILTILSDIGPSEIVEQLVPLLNDEDHRVRLELVKTFSKLAYTDGLLKALNDESVEVKAEALRGLKSQLSSEKFVKLLPNFKDTGDEVYIEIFKIIDEKKLFEAVAWLVEILTSLESRNDTVARDIKELGITTLARLQVDKAENALQALTQSKDKHVARFAAKTLERLA